MNVIHLSRFNNREADMAKHAVKFSLFALSATAFLLGSFPEGLSHHELGLSSALAKSSNAGRNGNGGGNASKPDNASSGKPSKESAGLNSNSRASDGKKPMILEKLFGKQKTQKAAISIKPEKSKVKQVAAKPSQKSKKSADALLASVGPKEKNLNAKLAGLNSLKRNFNAYINSNDPPIIEMRAFIEASIAYEDAVKEAADAQKLLDDAKLAFATLAGQIVSNDGAFDYTAGTVGTMATRLEALNLVDVTLLTAEQVVALDAEKLALQSALESEEAKTLAAAETTAAEAETAVAEMAGTADDAALTEALLAAANKNRVAEYGDAYVDAALLDWAKNLLGVGDAYGKIDEIRSATALAEEPAPVAEPVKSGI